MEEKRKSFILSKNKQETTVQGLLFAVFLLFVVPYFGIPDKYDIYIYIIAIIILILAVIQMSIINYEKIKNIRKTE